MLFHSYEVPRGIKFTRIESRMGVARGWGRGRGVGVNGDQSFSLENDKVLGMDGGGGCMAQCACS